MRHAETVEEQTAAWYARLTDQPAPEDRAAFAFWLAADPAHRKTYELLVRALGAADAALSDLNAPVDVFEDGSAALLPFRRPMPRFSRWTGAFKALAASLVLAAAGGLAYQALTRPDYVHMATITGEQRIEHLADGSTVTLNTRTRIAFAMEGNERRVKFEDGEAFFEVAKDPARPFIISLGTREVRVVGTAFNIRHVNAKSEVAVAEGIVSLTREIGPLASFVPPATSQQLTAGMAASYVPDADVLVRANVSSASVAPWRKGQLIYRGTRLADVIMDLDRYFPGKLIVRDRAASELKVSAVINLSDEKTVLATLARQLPIAVWSTPEGTTEIGIKP